MGWERDEAGLSAMDQADIRGLVPDIQIQVWRGNAAVTIEWSALAASMIMPLSAKNITGEPLAK